MMKFLDYIRIKISLNEYLSFFIRFISKITGDVGGRILSKKFCTSYHANSSQKHITNLLNTLHIKIMERSHKERKDRILYTRGKPYKILPKFFGAEVHNFFQRVCNVNWHIYDD